MNPEINQDTVVKEVRVDTNGENADPLVKDPLVKDIHAADSVVSTPFSTTNSASSVETIEDDLNADYSATSVSSPSIDESNIQNIQDRAAAILSNLPDYVTNFFKTYKQPIVTISLVIGSIIVLRVLLATIDAIFDTIDDVPFLTSLLELTGLVFWGWFTYRYLLQASNRQELVDAFNSTKERILGRS
ncbi:MAG TPA: CAAD domain-containing protein [Crinalium sp.]|jgi:hypothetical protein